MQCGIYLSSINMEPNIHLCPVKKFPPTVLWQLNKQLIFCEVKIVQILMRIKSPQLHKDTVGVLYALSKQTPMSQVVWVTGAA